MRSKDCLKISVSLPRETIEELDIIVQKKDVSRSSLIQKACTLYLRVNMEDDNG